MDEWRDAASLLLLWPRLFLDLALIYLEADTQHHAALGWETHTTFCNLAPTNTMPSLSRHYV